jgi:peptidoglycan/xylan/chitin deacetylase (PgdA/CDA1 family)
LKKDSYLAIDELLKMETGLKSTYYFLSAKTTRWYRNYGLDGEVRDKIKELKEDGCEIGLHATPYAYNNFKAMKREKEYLEKAVMEGDCGVRNHELRWDPRNSWQIQDRVGFQYDSTLTFPEKGGFRCGICHPFQPFDLRNNERLDIWEIPITLMDATLRDPKYLSMESEEAYEEMLRYLLIIEKFHGVFVLLWHTTSFDEVDWKGWREIYYRFITYISERDYFIDHCRNLLVSYCSIVAPEMKKDDKRR